MTRRTASLATRVGLLILAAGGYLWGLLTDPRLDSAARAREVFLKGTLRQASQNTVQDRALAEAYWTRYPDVAASPVYGRTSSLGFLGAREHYQRFGHNEGRVWTR